MRVRYICARAPILHTYVGPCAQATTVGYGDVWLTTAAARAWAAAHILVSVSWLAALVGVVEKGNALRKSQLERVSLLMRPLDREQVCVLYV